MEPPKRGGSDHDQGDQRRGLRTLGRRAAFGLTWWVVLVALWLLFVDTLAPAEVVLGLGMATGASLAAVGIRAYGGVRFRFRVRWLLLLRGVPASTLRDSATLARVLWRRLRLGEQPAGAFLTVPFPVRDGPEAAAWRAFVAGATSIAPNTYVIRYDRERATAIVHQLVPTPPDRARPLLVGETPEARREPG